MGIEEKFQKEFIVELMTTPLFSMNEKFGIVEKLKNNDLSEEEMNQILDLIHYFNKSLLSATNRYYKNMDTVYKQYLNNNISQLKQGVQEVMIQIKEEKENEKEGDSNLILDQIE